MSSLVWMPKIFSNCFCMSQESIWSESCTASRISISLKYTKITASWSTRCRIIPSELIKYPISSCLYLCSSSWSIHYPYKFTRCFFIYFLKTTNSKFKCGCGWVPSCHMIILLESKCLSFSKCTILIDYIFCCSVIILILKLCIWRRRSGIEWICTICTKW